MKKIFLLSSPLGIVHSNFDYKQQSQICCTFGKFRLKKYGVLAYYHTPRIHNSSIPFTQLFYFCCILFLAVVNYIKEKLLKGGAFMADKSLNNEELQELRRRLRARRLFLDLTYQQLADKTGMSKSTLQRYETGGIKNLPYDKILVLSKALEVPTSYFTDLDQDYTSTDTQKLQPGSPEGRREFMQQAKEFEEMGIEHITPKLIQQGYTVEKQDRGSLGDIIATRGKEVWHIDFKFISDASSYPVGLGMQRHDFMLRVGRLATYQGPVTKYSLFINLRAIGEQLIDRYKNIKVNIDMSILFLTDDGYEEIFFQK